MERFSDCRLALLGEEDQEVFVDEECEVLLEEGRIALSWFDDEGPVMFVGREIEPGRFELVCRSRPRTATVSRVDVATLEGEWTEDDSTGRLRVRLGAAQR